jgi:hypothetical protein
MTSLTVPFLYPQSDKSVDAPSNQDETLILDQFIVYGLRVALLFLRAMQSVFIYHFRDIAEVQRLRGSFQNQDEPSRAYHAV